MMDKLKTFAIITFFIYVSYVTSASAIKCYSCSDEIECQRTVLYNVTEDCTDACATIFDQFLPVKKSCVTNLTTTEAELCNDSSNPLCYICTNDYCNNLARIDHKCITCTTNIGNSSCLQDPTKISGTRCPAPTVDGAYCFVSSDGGSTTRGCITTARELESCSGNNCNTCPVNSTYPCNSYPIPTNRIKCVHCSGTNCNSVSSGSLYCTYPDDSCVSINNYGNHSQGCARDRTVDNTNFCNDHKRSCTTCSSDDCNRALPGSPSEYNECYSCEGISCQRSTLYTQTTECEKNDTCATLFENYIPIKKSCYADLSPNEKIICNNTNNPLCYKCSGSRCNNMGRIDHKCISCNTSTNANCLQNPQNVRAIRCQAPISDDAYCFIKSAGDSVTRGCLNTPHEISTCLNNKQQCSFCAVNNGSACNSFEFPAGRRKCHYTRGANPTALSTTQSKYCTYATDTCLIIKSNGTLSQICAREMNSTEIRICNNHSECCKTCTSNNCNTLIPDSECLSPISSNDSNVHNPMLLTIIMFTALVSFMRFHSTSLI